jgi:hypothetical protein
MFNRGKTNPTLFPNVEHLEGDRNGKLDALRNREWDAVIDNPATLPRWVRETAQLLKEKAGQYVFISTLSVYKDNSKIGMDESDPVNTLADPTVEQITGETYGGLKALAEDEARRAFGDRATVVRPGLIVGPGDNTDRFTYWPVRIARGGDVLAPGDPNNPVQIIDARDLGEWTIRVVENNTFGTLNAIGPAGQLTMAEMLGGIGCPPTFSRRKRSRRGATCRSGFQRKVNTQASAGARTRKRLLRVSHFARWPTPPGRLSSITSRGPRNGRPSSAPASHRIGRRKSSPPGKPKSNSILDFGFLGNPKSKIQNQLPPTHYKGLSS